jgi:hypothetical protein
VLEIEEEEEEEDGPVLEIEEEGDAPLSPKNPLLSSSTSPE